GQLPEVAVFVPAGKDRSRIAAGLKKNKIKAQMGESLEQVNTLLGETTDVIVLSEETLLPAKVVLLLDALHQQPAWSDIPMIVLARRGGADGVEARTSEILGASANVTLLPHPFRTPAL